MTTTFTDYTVDKVTVESTTIKSFYLKPSNGSPIPSFLPGQYVNVRLNLGTADRYIIRSYTLSDSPGKDYLRLTIKQEPEGKSSNYFYSKIHAGDIISLSMPLGNFTLDTQNTGPVVFLSGGVGITPMLSMTEYVHENQPNRQVHFIHSSRNKHVQPMLPRLQQIKALCRNFNLSVLHSSPMDDELLGTDYDLKGRITKEIIPTAHQDANYYVCGPNEYIKDVRNYLMQLGVPNNQVFFEYFGESIQAEQNPAPEESTGEGYKITLLKSGKEVLWNKSKGSLLELAESVGLSPEYSCRMGTCSTCESKLVKGTYEYDPEPFMETADDKVLICCAIPTSDIEIDL